MQDFPHHYVIDAEAESEGTVALKGEQLPLLVSAPPAEFGGPGDQWSPEHLLVASVASCFVQTFRAVAGASRLEWVSLQVQVEGVLDRVDKVMQFTSFKVSAVLNLPEGANEDKVQRLLEKSEANCLVTNSFKAPCHLETTINFSS